MLKKILLERLIRERVIFKVSLYVYDNWKCLLWDKIYFDIRFEKKCNKWIIKLVLIYFFFIKVYSDFVGVVIRGVMVVIDGNVMVINFGEDVKWVCI